MWRISLIVIIILCFGCAIGQKENDSNYKTLKLLLNKEIIIDEQLFTEIEGSTSLLNIQLINDLPFKIVTVISLDCGDCIESMENWVKNISELQIPLLIIICGNNSNYAKDLILKSEKKIDFILFDKDDNFVNVNNIPDELIFRTFLLDSDNKIKVIGNPIENPKVKILYDREIEKTISKIK